MEVLARLRHSDAALLTLMVASIAVFNLIWVGVDSDRLTWDYARHLGDSLFYKDTFSLAHPIHYLEGYTYYPPFMYWVTDLFYAVFGTGLWVAILSNTVFLSILVFATYGIGKTLWSPRVGLLSAFFVVTTPLFVTQSREYMLDMPLTALVALALYLLIRSDNFADRRMSLLFGAACGCGVLLKWTFPAFVFLPAAFAAGTAVLVWRREGSRERLDNILGAGLIFLALAALWYLPNYHEFRVDAKAQADFPASLIGVPPVGSLASWLWYLWSLVNVELYLIPTLFFLAGIVYLFRRSEAARSNLPLILSLVGAYVALSLITIKDVRQAMPMVPAVAVLATSWLEYLRPRTRQWLVAGLVGYGVLTFLVISFGTSAFSNTVKIPIATGSLTSDVSTFAPPKTTRVTGLVLFNQRPLFLGPASDEEWHQEDVFKEMVARGGPNPSFWFTDPADSIWFNTWGIRYYSYRYGATWVGLPQEAQFLLIRGPTPAGVTTGFTEVKRYGLPYGGPLTLYQRL